MIQGGRLALLALTVLRAGRIWAGGAGPGVLVAGFGQGMSCRCSSASCSAEVPMEQAGVGSGVMVTTQQSALALGVATLGALFLALRRPRRP